MIFNKLEIHMRSEIEIHLDFEEGKIEHMYKEQNRKMRIIHQQGNRGRVKMIERDCQGC